MQSYIKITEYYEPKTWVYLRNNSYYQSEVNYEYVGKWMLFTSLTYVDDLWTKITNVFNEGKIWSVKCRTLFKNLKNNFVICIYTKDYRDKEEVTNLLKLIQQNFLFDPSKKIFYKTDNATLTGIYGNNSWLYCSDGLGLLSDKKVNDDIPKKRKQKLNKHRDVLMSLEEIQKIIELRLNKYFTKDLSFVLSGKAYLLDENDLESYKNKRFFELDYIEETSIKDISEHAKILAILQGAKRNNIVFRIWDSRNMNFNLNIQLRTKNRKLLAKKAIIEDEHVIELTYDVSDSKLFFKFNHDMQLLKDQLIEIFRQKPGKRKD